MPRLRLDPILKRISSIYQSKVVKTVKEATKRRITQDSLKLITNISSDMRVKIETVLKEGENEGRSVAATASKLLTTGLDEGVFRSARVRAYLIARTELHRARQEAALDIYKAADIKYVVWVGIPDDGRICAHCKALHGKHFHIDKIEETPPLHPRCRCRILPSKFQLHLKPKRKGVSELTISPVPADYRYVVNIKKLKGLEKSVLQKAKLIYVPASPEHKAYYRTDPRSKLVKKIFKVTFADGSKAYVEGYSKWDATQRAKSESKFTTVDAEEIKEREVPSNINIKPILISEEGIKKARPYIRIRRGKLEHVKGYARNIAALAKPEQAIDQAWDLTRKDVQIANSIITTVSKAGGQALIVGGFIRDALLGKISKDIDIEVYGVRPDALRDLLEKTGKSVDTVGASFGVFKISDPELSEPIDVSAPRRDSKIGEGHKGFAVEAVPDMTVEEATRRRDLTINSLSYNPITKTLIDPYNGLQDIKDRKLRAIDPEAFVEDPLRVLRVMQFAARFGMTPDLNLAKICRATDLLTLPRERIAGEFEKLLLKSRTPSIGLRLIPILGIDKIVPELMALQGSKQDPDWHPEGDVWVHTLGVTDAAAKLKNVLKTKQEKMIFMLSALLHDIAKPQTEAMREDGRITNIDHASQGAELAVRFLNRFTNEKNILEGVEKLVKYHLVPDEFYKAKAGNSAIRRLARKVNIPTLTLLSMADKLGTGRPKPGFEAEKWLLNKYKELKLGDPKTLQPKVMGRHLLELGIEPGPQMGQILNQIYEGQLEGKFQTTEEGIEYARELRLIKAISVKGKGKLEIVEKAKRIYVPSSPKRKAYYRMDPRDVKLSSKQAKEIGKALKRIDEAGFLLDEKVIFGRGTKETSRAEFQHERVLIDKATGRTVILPSTIQLPYSGILPEEDLIHEYGHFADWILGGKERRKRFSDRFSEWLPSWNIENRKELFADLFATLVYKGTSEGLIVPDLKEKSEEFYKWFDESLKTEISKAIPVKGFTRRRKGKLEIVRPFERTSRERLKEIETAPPGLPEMEKRREEAKRRIIEWKTGKDKFGIERRPESNEEIVLSGYRWRQRAHKYNDAWDWAVWEEIQKLAQSKDYKYKEKLTKQDLLDNPLIPDYENVLGNEVESDSVTTGWRNNPNSTVMWKFINSEVGQRWSIRSKKEIWSTIKALENDEIMKHYPGLIELKSINTWEEALNTTIEIYRGIPEEIEKLYERRKFISYTIAPAMADKFARGYYHSYDAGEGKGLVVKRTVKFEEILGFVNNDGENEILVKPPKEIHALFEEREKYKYLKKAEEETIVPRDEIEQFKKQIDPKLLKLKRNWESRKIEKSIPVKGFTRRRKGRLEIVKPFERIGVEQEKLPWSWETRSEAVKPGSVVGISPKSDIEKLKQLGYEIKEIKYLKWYPERFPQNVGSETNPVESPAGHDAYKKDGFWYYKFKDEEIWRRVTDPNTIQSWNLYCWKKEGKEVPIEKSDYSSVQVDLPPLIAYKVKRLMKLIDPEDIQPDEKVDEPHITIRYGLHTEKPKEVEDILGRIEFPILASVLGVDVFQPKDKGHDVLVLRADSPQLSELNLKLDELPNTTEFRFYQPHITIAYLKPGTGKKYQNMITGLEGQGIRFYEANVEFSDKDWKKTPLFKSEDEGIDLKKAFNKVKLTVNENKVRELVRKLKKSKQKLIPYREDGKIIWAKPIEKGLIFKNVKFRKGDSVLLKGGDIGNITAIGRNGITARDDDGNKYQILNKHVKIVKEIRK